MVSIVNAKLKCESVAKREGKTQIILILPGNKGEAVMNVTITAIGNALFADYDPGKEYFFNLSDKDLFNDTNNKQ